MARSYAIRHELGETKKCDLSVTAFFNTVKGLADTLASIGQPLCDEEFTAYIINGLDGDYDSLVENINGRDTPIQPRELYARLLSTEQRVSARRSVGIYTDASSANAAYRGGGKPAPRPASSSTSGGGKPATSTPPQ